MKLCAILVFGLILFNCLNNSNCENTVDAVDEDSKEEEEPRNMTVHTCHVKEHFNDETISIIFKCLGWNEKHAFLFSDDDQVHCIENDKLIELSKKHVSIISFEDCEMEVIDKHILKNISSAYTELHTFDISDLKLKSFDLWYMRDAQNLEKIFASGNKLEEFPELNRQFIEFPHLAWVDLSDNKINTLNPNGFKMMPNLRHLDLSTNNISNLPTTSFVLVSKLHELDLSGNDLSNIQLGLFSFQTNLRVLNLASNNLKRINFDTFLPSMPHLHELSLYRNLIDDMDGFTNAMFPELRHLDIRGNPFNCSYLAKFLREIDWSDIDLVASADDHIIDDIPNIRGISCDQQNVTNLGNDTITQTEQNFVDKYDEYLPIVSISLVAFQSTMLFIILITILTVSCKIGSGSRSTVVIDQS